MDDYSLPDWAVPGRRFRYDYGKNNPNTRSFQIRGIVDGMIVVRWWRKRKQWWHYEVIDGMELHFRKDVIVVGKIEKLEGDPE